MTEKIAILVIGMHRSGSSAMARLLSLAGAALPKGLMGAAPSNEMGHWEPQRVADLNDEVLSAFDVTWSSPFGLGMNASRRALLESYVDAARDVVRADYGNKKLIVLKEPRVSLLADLWAAACEAEGYRCKFVIMVRSPLEVAASLRHRDGIAFDHGLILWASYEASAEILTRQHERIFCRYEDVLVKPTSVLDDIEVKFGMELPRRTAKSHAAINAFIRPNLRHNNAKTLPNIPSHLKAIEDIFQYIEGLTGHADGSSEGRPSNEDKSNDVQQWLADLDKIVSPIIIPISEERDRAVAQALEQSENHGAEFHRRIEVEEALRSEIETLAGQIQETRAQQTHAEHRVLESQRELESVRREVEQRDTELVTLRTALTEVAAVRDAQTADAAELGAALTTAGETANALLDRVRELEAGHAHLSDAPSGQDESHAHFLAEVAAERERIQGEVETLRALVQTREAELATFQAALEAANATVVELTAIRDAHAAEATELRATLATETALLEHTREIEAHNAQLKREILETAQSHAGILAEATAEREQLRAEIETLRIGGQASDHELDTLRVALATSDATAASLVAHSQDLEVDQARIAAEAQAAQARLQAEVETAQAYGHARDTELLEARAALDGANAALAAATATHDAQAIEIVELRAALVTTGETATNLAERTTELEASRSQLEDAASRSAQALERSVAEATAERERLQGEIEKSRAYAQACDTELSELRASLATSEETAAAVSARNRKLEASISDLNASASQRFESHAEMLAQAAADREQLEADIETSYALMRARNTELGDLRATLADVTEMRDANAAEVTELRATLTMVSQNAATATARIRDLETRYAKLRAELGKQTGANAKRLKPKVKAPVSQITYPKRR
ncbi:hypothetical protein [Sphingomonas sp. UYP23]